MIKTRNYQDLNEAIAAFTADSQLTLKEYSKHNCFSPHSAHRRKKVTKKKRDSRSKNCGYYARPKSPKQKKL